MKATQIKYSVIVPIYRNADGISALLDALKNLDLRAGEFEVVFVVDGSPDNSFERLRTGLEGCSFNWQLLELSRNFGSFTAIRQGLSCARGSYFAAMAADLQEPPELITEFFRLLVGICASRPQDRFTLEKSRFWNWRKRCHRRALKRFFCHFSE